MAGLIDYLNASVSPYHAVCFSESLLKDAGFEQLDLKKKFRLKEGGAYYLKPYPTALFAFVLPDKICEDTNFHIACAHTDFPTFKLKPEPQLNGSAGNCKRVNTEPYGGMLKKTWFDRPLGLAGLVVVKGENPYEPKSVLFDSGKAWFVIPSLAPHMDREIEKKEPEAVKEMLPIFALGGSLKESVNSKESGCSAGPEDINIMDAIADRLGVKTGDILSFDLSLYDITKAESAGLRDDFVMSERIDNEASVAALVNSLVKIKNESGSKKKEKKSGTKRGGASSKYRTSSVSLIALFDNEEIGSRSKQGADSEITEWIVERIAEAEICNKMDYKSALAGGLLLSVDGAHAVHPNYPEKADITTQAVLGDGIVIKTSASQRYVTDPRALAIIKDLCQRENLPFQLQANRTGIPGGQTLGPIVSSYLPIHAVDIGVPMLAMHSAREMMAVDDYRALEGLLSVFLG